MKNFQIILDAVKKTQAELAAYAEPGNHDAKATISKLLKIWDDKEVVAAVKALDLRSDTPNSATDEVVEAEQRLHKALPGS